ncbi:hypothetical protein [Spirosoma montaniterrae]|uniref:Small multi-drug export protein n=1 Tax=Spirosoma montaniterrae TaxID=1178516 RepID=A0A1P9X1U9_9BACT|nr:hypothetical protein [Spirosoma montaniterrae]AQG81591.1 hypothetical protein AWR27_21130 [Spirosoma montaniterrae]
MSVARYVSVILASTIKFVGGPLSGAALGLSWFETALCTMLGMMLSVVAVVYAGAALQALLQRYRTKPPQRFTRRTRLAVRIWQRSGMAGIALLTPLILTPIGGTALAVSFRVPRPTILLYMLVSAILWAIIQTIALYQIPGLAGLLNR